MTRTTHRDLFTLENYDEIQDRFDTKSARIRYLRFEKDYSEQEIATFLGLRRQHVNNVCREENVKDVHAKRLAEWRKSQKSTK
jgi:DNA-binding XRE family transcriptional regulator